MRLSLPAVYALGVAASGVIATAFVMGAVIGVRGDGTYDFWDASIVFVLSAAGGGIFGGWSCWTWIVRAASLSIERAFCVAAAATGMSLLIGSLLGALTFAVIAFVLAIKSGLSQALRNFGDVLLPSLIVAPIYSAVMFGLPFIVLVLIWTFWRRDVVNRAAQTKAPKR